MPSVQGLAGIPGGPLSTDQVLVSRAGVAYNMLIGDLGYLQFATFAAVRANTAVTPSFQLIGGSTTGDGAQGMFLYAASDTTSADNGGTVLVDAAGHRYYRQTGGGPTSIMWFGAKADCQVATTTVSMAVGSHTLTVGSPIFAAGDVGKSIAVTRTDAIGWCPWYTTAAGYAAAPTITGYISPTQVTVSAPGNALPPGNNGASWPYNATPSIVSWGTDNGPAIQAACTAADNVTVPDGNFALATPVFLKSKNALFGSGTSGTLTNLGVAYGGTSNVCPMIQNVAVKSGPTTGPAYGGIPAARASYGDQDISVYNLVIDMQQAGCGYGGITCRMFFLERGKFHHLRIIGNPITGFEGVNLIGCDAIDITDNEYLNCLNGSNPWSGLTNVTYARNRLTIPPITTASFAYTSAVPLGIGINAIGINGVEQPVSGINIVDNTIFLNGSEYSGLQSTGIYLWPDGNDSFIKNSRIERNTIICTGSNNAPIQCTGGTIHCVVAENIIEAADGAVFEPIKVFNIFVNTSSYSANLTSVVSTSGSTTITVNWTNHEFQGLSLGSLPFFLSVTGGPTVGGVYLNGRMRILAVVNANSFTVQVPIAATSTQTVSWNGAFAQIQSGSSNMIIERNQLRDCSAPPSSASLIYVEGQGNIIRNNAATYSNLSEAPPYASIVACSSSNVGRSHIVSDNTGPNGSLSLPAGYSGTQRVSYFSLYSPPLIIDPGDSPTTSPSFATVHATSLTLANAAPIVFTDAEGNNATLVLQADNNFVFYGTNASGSPVSILSIGMHTATPALSIGVPIAVEGGAFLTGGSGAPSGSTVGSAQPGSVWIRTDGSSGSRIYISQGGGSWAAIPGV